MKNAETGEFDYNAHFPTADAMALEAYPGDSLLALARRATIIAAIEADRQLVRDYIEAHEHPDDWGVPCVYTKTLRESLGMAPSLTESERWTQLQQRVEEN